MQDYSAIEDYCGDYGVALGVITLHKDGELNRYLGKLLLKNYKKSDPKQQSLWNSDTGRLSYVVRTLAGDKPTWIADKKAIQLKDNINPLLFHLDKEVCTFLSKKKKPYIG
jgi:hypothetical protein